VDEVNATDGPEASDAVEEPEATHITTTATPTGNVVATTATPAVNEPTTTTASPTARYTLCI
jgi:hypothetical protein